MDVRSDRFRSAPHDSRLTLSSLQFRQSSVRPLWSLSLERSVKALGTGSRPQGKVAIDLNDGVTTFNSNENIAGIGSATEGLQAFWSASASVESMSALCQRIANGFTMYMRNSMPAAPDARYAPTVYADATFVHVRWGWLAFPFSLLLAGHIFLLTTIWHTRRLRTQPWKGHRIPLLLASIDDVVKDATAGGLDSRTGLEERVGRFKVRLEYDDGDEIVFKRVV
jgi:hypothetical protein